MNRSAFADTAAPTAGPARGRAAVDADADGGFREFASASPQSVWVADAALRVVDANASWRRYVGEAAAGRVARGDWPSIVHPDDTGTAFACWREGLRRRAPWSCELRLRRHDGAWRWHHVTATPAPCGTGAGMRWYGFDTDIHDRRLAEEALRASEARFRALVSASAQVVWTAAPDGSVIEDSPSWCAFAGEPPTGRGRPERIHPEDRARVDALWRDCIATRRVFEAEYRIASADGRWGWVHSRGVPMPNPDGTIREWVGMNVDVTERKRAERALQDSEARLQAKVEELDSIYQAAPIGMSLCDRDFRFLRVNRAMADIDGAPVHAHLGRTLREVVPGVADVVEPHFRRVLETGEPSVGIEVAGHTASQPGVERTWLVSYYPIFEAGGRVRAISCLVYEISELRRAQAALIEADRRKDEFLATLAHELRNPLAPIRTGLVLLRRAPADGRMVTATHEMMERQLLQMVRLVDDLLDVSRISRGRIELRPGRFALQDIVASAVEASRHHLDAGQHVLTVAQPRDPLRVDVDATRMAQVVGNLLNNAAKFTPPGGLVELSVAAEGGEAVLRVRDSGVGMAPDLLPKVFDLFMQARRTIDRSQGGLGIGLSLVRQLVAMHGGTVGAESEGPGRGSCFTVRLPLPADLA
ncbi:MAG TPA: PAS domain-containing protein [Burkholderiaceae bacterium]|nr:PAS domain-containing protein [Burkholderiaceae bacterium]